MFSKSIYNVNTFFNSVFIILYLNKEGGDVQCKLKVSLLIRRFPTGIWGNLLKSTTAVTLIQCSINYVGRERNICTNISLLDFRFKKIYFYLNTILKVLVKKKLKVIYTSVIVVNDNHNKVAYYINIQSTQREKKNVLIFIK